MEKLFFVLYNKEEFMVINISEVAYTMTKKRKVGYDISVVLKNGDVLTGNKIYLGDGSNYELYKLMNHDSEWWHE